MSIIVVIGISLLRLGAEVLGYLIYAVILRVL